MCGCGLSWKSNKIWKHQMPIEQGYISNVLKWILVGAHILTQTDTSHHVTSSQSINSLNIEPYATEPKNRKYFDNLSLNCVLDAYPDTHWKTILNRTHTQKVLLALFIFPFGLGCLVHSFSSSSFLRKNSFDWTEMFTISIKFSCHLPTHFIYFSFYWLMIFFEFLF